MHYKLNVFIIILVVVVVVVNRQLFSLSYREQLSVLSLFSSPALGCFWLLFLLIFHTQFVLAYRQGWKVSILSPLTLQCGFLSLS